MKNCAKIVNISYSILRLMNAKSSVFTVGTVHFPEQGKNDLMRKLVKTLLLVVHKRMLLYQKSISAKNCFSICSIWSCSQRLRAEDEGFDLHFCPTGQKLW